MTADHDLERDCDVVSSMTRPSREREFNLSHRQQVRINIALRGTWHAIFDPCPSLQEIDDENNGVIFRPFMEWAYEHGHPLDWTLHLSVYDWLGQSPLVGKLSKKVCREVRAVAAAQWAAFDRSSFLGIAIAHSSDPTWTVAFKARNVHLIRTVEEIDIGSPPAPPEHGFGYFLIPSWKLETFPGWTLLNNVASQN